MKLVARLLLIGCTVGSIANRVHAQRLADPNAIDLTPFLMVIDSTSHGTYLYEPRNVGDQNNDGFDDVYLRGEITDDSGQSTVTNELGLLHADGSLTRLPFNIQNFILAGDIDGDGLKDIFDYVQGFEFRYLLHHASSMLSDNDTLLFTDGEGRAILVGDLDEDGIPDLLTNYTGTSMAFYRGPVAVNTVLRADDSLRYSKEQSYPYNLLTTLGRFLPDHRPRLLTVSSSVSQDWLWHLSAELYPPKAATPSLWDAEPQTVFRDSVRRDVFVYTTPTLVCDFTGDGLDDLIVSDSAHIYIYAGGPNFGSRVLAKSEATLVLTSPALLDSAHFKYWGYPLWISFVGDITGSGIPYIAVGSGYWDTSIVYLYAGGSAIDPYYDAFIRTQTSGNLSFTPVAFGSARTAALLTTRLGDSSRLDLLHNGTELIPHVQRSAVHDAPHDKSDFVVEYSASRVTLRTLRDIHYIGVYNVLGEPVLNVILQAGTGAITPGELPAGMYWLRTDGLASAFKMLMP